MHASSGLLAGTVLAIGSSTSVAGILPGVVVAAVDVTAVNAVRTSEGESPSNIVASDQLRLALKDLLAEGWHPRLASDLLHSVRSFLKKGKEWATSPTESVNSMVQAVDQMAIDSAIDEMIEEENEEGSWVMRIKEMSRLRSKDKGKGKAKADAMLTDPLYHSLNPLHPPTASPEAPSALLDALIDSPTAPLQLNPSSSQSNTTLHLRSHTSGPRVRFSTSPPTVHTYNLPSLSQPGTEGALPTLSYADAVRLSTPP
ncbi:hypothetical protein FRB99_000768, partial [Tulasnella sp. 403]